jgi:hypothetical protein
MDAVRRISDIPELSNAAPGYPISSLVDKDLVIYAVERTRTQYGEAWVIHFMFKDTGLKGRAFTSGVVLSRKLSYIKEHNLLPIEGRVVRPGRYYDII